MAGDLVPGGPVSEVGGAPFRLKSTWMVPTARIAEDKVPEAKPLLVCRHRFLVSVNVQLRHSISCQCLTEPCQLYGNMDSDDDKVR